MLYSVANVSLQSKTVLQHYMLNQYKEKNTEALF